MPIITTPIQATQQEWDIAKGMLATRSHPVKLSRKENAELKHSFISVLDENGQYLFLALAPKGQYFDDSGKQATIKAAYDENGKFYVVKIKPTIVKTAALQNAVQAAVPDNESRIKKKLDLKFYEFQRTSSTRKMNTQPLDVKEDETIVKAYFVERYLGKTLHSYKSLLGGSKIEHRITVANMLLDQLQAMHNKGVIHCDLHDKNVLLMKNGNELLLSIIDFGLAREVGKDELTVPSNVRTMVNMGVLDPYNRTIIEARYALKEQNLDILSTPESSKPLKFSFASDCFSAYLIIENSLNIIMPDEDDIWARIQEDGIEALRSELLEAKERALDSRRGVVHVSEHYINSNTDDSPEPSPKQRKINPS